VVFAARAAEVPKSSLSLPVPSPSSLSLTSYECAGKARDGLYEPVLADSEREAVADLLQYLENVRRHINNLVAGENLLLTRRLAGRN